MSAGQANVTIKVDVEEYMRAIRRLIGARVPYEDLTDDEREAIHEWCRTHHIEPKDTPINPVIELDPLTDEWRIEQFVRRDGQLVLDRERDRVLTKFVRRVRKADLAWRRE